MTMKNILFTLFIGWMTISFTACDDFLTESHQLPFQRMMHWLLLRILKML